MKPLFEEIITKRFGSLIEYLHYNSKNTYHNWNHIKLVFELNYECPSKEAAVAAIFHDANYIPLTLGNEEIACKAVDFHKDKLQDVDLKKVKKLILSTKDHVASYKKDPDLVWLHNGDLFYLKDEAESILPIDIIEGLIRKEYKKIKYPKYVSERIKVLKYLAEHPLVSTKRVEAIIKYLEKSL